MNNFSLKARWKMNALESIRNFVVVEVSGIVLTRDSWQFSREFSRIAGRYRNKNIILALGSLVFVSIEAIQYLAAHYRPRPERDVCVTLVASPRLVGEEIGRLGGLPYLRYSESLEEAIAGVS